MKLFILLAAFLLGSCAAALAGNVVTSFPVVAGGDPVPTDITFWWTFEATTLGESDYSAGDTTATAVGDAVLNATSVKYGTNGGDFPSAGDEFNLDISNADIINAAECRIGFWFYSNTFVNAATILRIVLDADNVITIQESTTTSNHILFSFEDAATTLYVDNLDVIISNGQWYFIEIAISDTSNALAVYVNGDEDSDATTMTGNGFAVTGVPIEIGNTGAAGSDFYLDNLMISNDPTRDFYNNTFNGTAYKDLTESPR